jgi:hypothetical protein
MFRWRAEIDPRIPRKSRFFFVGDAMDTPYAVSLGGGIDVRIGPRVSVGLGGGHYFSEDSDRRGALDWFARSYLGWNFPF